jgi:hypothetical protein
VGREDNAAGPEASELTRWGKSMKTLRRIGILFLLLLPLLVLPSDGAEARARRHQAEYQSDRVEQIVYITRTGHKYHRAGCRYLRYSAIPVDINDAIGNGYTPCKICRP